MILLQEVLQKGFLDPSCCVQMLSTNGRQGSGWPRSYWSSCIKPPPLLTRHVPSTEAISYPAPCKLHYNRDLYITKEQEPCKCPEVCVPPALPALTVAHESQTSAYPSCTMWLLVQRGAAACKVVDAAQLINRARMIALLIAAQQL